MGGKKKHSEDLHYNPRKSTATCFDFLLHKSGFLPDPSPSLFPSLQPPLTRKGVMTVRNPLHRRTRPGALGDVPCAALLLGLAFPTSGRYPSILAPISLLGGQHRWIPLEYRSGHSAQLPP